MTMTYRGRFAPSPTGPLHLGSLVAAMASYLDAKSNKGVWLLRIDDVDQARCISGMAQILENSLREFGFIWDEAISFQSQYLTQHQKTTEQLLASKQAYYCDCSRKKIASIAKKGVEGYIYPGTCRHKPQIVQPASVRLKTDSQIIGFQDRLMGYQQQCLAEDIGDFVVQRVDGYTAYQLAVVIDDHLQNISHVVRGADLLLSTPRQIFLQQLLGYTSPEYAHIPLVLDPNGKKLSKQLKADPVDPDQPVKYLHQAWNFLFPSHSNSLPTTLEQFWPWAIANWNLQKCLIKPPTK